MKYNPQQFIEETEREFEKILSSEMEGILMMSSEQRFDMVEKILKPKGKVMSLLRSRLLALLALIEARDKELRDKSRGRDAPSCTTLFVLRGNKKSSPKEK